MKSLEYSNVKDASGAVATGVRDTPDAALSLVHGLGVSTVIIVIHDLNNNLSSIVSDVLVNKKNNSSDCVST